MLVSRGDKLTRQQAACGISFTSFLPRYEPGKEPSSNLHYLQTTQIQETVAY